MHQSNVKCLTKTNKWLDSIIKLHVLALLRNHFSISTKKKKFSEASLLRFSSEKFYEDMHKIYRKTPMPKCDFNKVARQLSRNRTSALVLSCKFAAYFQNTFLQEHLWRDAFDDYLFSRNGKLYWGTWLHPQYTDSRTCQGLLWRSKIFYLDNCKLLHSYH